MDSISSLFSIKIDHPVSRIYLKAPVTTAADDIHKYFFSFFSEKMRLDISCESSARQRIHMKLQALFSSKNKVKKLNCRLLQFLFGALRVEKYGYTSRESNSTIFIFHFLHSCIFFIFFFPFFFAALLKLDQLIRKVLPPLNVDPLVEGIHYQEKQTV